MNLYRLGWILAFVLAGILRLWHLNSVPSAWGDETVLATFTLNLAAGGPVEIPPERKFTPITYERIAALSFSLLGPTYGALRFPTAMVTLVGAGVLLLLGPSWKLGPGAKVIAACMLFHPWQIMFGRISFHYTFALVLGVLGPLAWYRAVHVQGKWRQVLALVGAGQILMLGFHFSPLAVIPLLACGFWTALTHFSLLWTSGPWFALATMVAHAWPIVSSAWQLSRNLPSEFQQGLVVLESIDTFSNFPEKLLRYLGVLIDNLSGEATVRDFSNEVLPGWALWIQRSLVVLGLALAMGNILRYEGPKLAKRKMTITDTGNKAKDCCPQPGMDFPTATSGSLGLLSIFILLLALPGLAIMLSFGRYWSLMSLYDERYGFVVLGPTILLLGVLANYYSSRVRAVIVGAIILFALVPSGRIFHGFAWGGGPSTGMFHFDGSGYPSWKIARGPQSIPEAIWETLEQEARQEPITMIPGEEFGLSGVELQIKASGREDIDRRWVWTDAAGNNHWPYLPPGRKVLLVAWSDELFVPGFRPPGIPALNRMIREGFKSSFQGRKLRDIQQPDGSPLLELWVGRAPQRP